MKKWKPILAAAVIFLLLNGCGAGEDLPSPEAGTDSQPAQENLQKDICPILVRGAIEEGGR